MGAAIERDDWIVWLILAGRGFGKTKSGAELVREVVETRQAKRIGLIGATAADCRDVMVEGDSGILACCPPWNRPAYEPSKRRLTWPSGAIATCYSADEPERLRGPQHDFIWGDEPAAWRYSEAWDQALFGLRLGKRPRAVLTTTPKPIKLIRDLIKDPNTVVTVGRTSDNEENLAGTFLTTVVAKYKGTRLGRQELDAELLDDIPGALWTYKLIEDTRCRHDAVPEMVRIVVAIDPSGTKGAIVNPEGKSNDVGIVVCGRGVDGHGYVLEDLTINASPAVWGRRAVDAFYRHKADRIIGEDNFGGAMVEHVVRTTDKTVPYKSVHASRGKVLRAEPVSGLYEQSKCHNVGTLALLETQMTQMTTQGYLGEGSPDRLDAMVWAFIELMVLQVRGAKAQVGKAGYRRR